MDDLAGLSWTSSSQSSKPANPTPTPAYSSYPSLRPSPSPFASGRNTPISAQGSGASGPKPAAKAPQDSFSNLVNFGSSSKPSATLSLKEQQERLEAEKRKKEEERRKQAESQFGSHFLDSLGSGATRQRKPLPPPPQPSKPTPPPGLDLSNPTSWNATTAPGGGASSKSGFPGVDDDDDDPFGLNQLANRKAAAKPSTQPAVASADDDFLGDLGLPVEQVRQRQEASKQPEPGKPIELSESDSDDDDEPPAPAAPARGRPSGGRSDPFDKAVAQLVDYGFSPEDARRGLTESGAGLNVQSAVNWLLDDAHRQSKEKAKGRRLAAASQGYPRCFSGTGATSMVQGYVAKQQPAGSRRRRLGQDGCRNGDQHLQNSQFALENGAKKVQQAVADFQYEGDPNQPKWMRSAQQDMVRGSEKHPEITDEAGMLASGSRPSRRQQAHTQQQPSSSRERSPAHPAPSSRQSTATPKWQQQSQPLDPRSRLNKLAADDGNFTSYVSPNRRRKATPAAEESKPPPPPAEEPDLLFGTSSTPSTRLPQRPAQRSPAPAASTPRPAPAPVRKATPRPTRQIPAISPAALQSSTKHRLEGTAHFKRGDFASAHESYSASLSAVPAAHPLAIVLLTNRALTSLKTGEPKRALEDADAAVNLIGPSLGQGETVAVKVETGGEEHRDMKDLYGKALSRKAEALEQMERWADAGTVWQLCVEAGVGGASAIAGRQRCQKALAPKPKPAPRPAAAAARPTPRPSALADLGPQKSSEAVVRLRAANEAAAREDEEKFAISERVDAKLASWRDGKKENLRALLGSLDQVLWEGSGWKKVGLHELVMANKVKIVYMKAIAKTHPDKLPQNASTEVRLIAGTVFSTLNESWDKFKAENGL
ncbi:unnamed protein product [Parascedosporium putredinis]|uniref:UBA domain-containing protein n=1 Tax=Parascedosporium putredinis TaxID=1442378 RepID=A0A9P1GUY8_9PEZI|nr:unnamed protein product [Parascedosporium putredinis]CAI7987571.1 unnamed protein product [Parascedosporium putredinis]